MVRVLTAFMSYVCVLSEGVSVGRGEGEEEGERVENGEEEGGKGCVCVTEST